MTTEELKENLGRNQWLLSINSLFHNQHISQAEPRQPTEKHYIQEKRFVQSIKQKRTADS